MAARQNLSLWPAGGATAAVDEDDASETVATRRYLQQARHLCHIDAESMVQENWRMKDRMKTVSVALVLCLHVEVDPPDILKTKPCARLETWIDPQTSTKPAEHIAANLQQQYQRWQPKARYRHAIDPTADEVKKLCTALRRNAKDDRVVLHYNGHGVPRPTNNGEIWVFNKNYSQYIPLSLCDLQLWMLTPSVYVFDCSSAARVFSCFTQQQQTCSSSSASCGGGGVSGGGGGCMRCIVLAACGHDEVLPQHPALPADLFTCCLVTPVKMALQWYVLSGGGGGRGVTACGGDITAADMDRVPGVLTDRRTTLGELNWIFTSITDTIAWNTLPRALFQRLFRQDLLVASLFRNYLLAERVMKSYDCHPATLPSLPATNQHSMWSTWDLAVDACVVQLRASLRQCGKSPPGGATIHHAHSVFFEQQLTAFQVWLQFGVEVNKPPEQLPIVLQVLLSQAHRVRALDLLSRFVELGVWSVSEALAVGIFPYVLKLLQAPARELRPLLVIIWAKIMALDPSCQVDLVRDNGHRYFLDILADMSMPAQHRTMAAFVVATIVKRHRAGQTAALRGNLIIHCVEQLELNQPHLRCWLAIALGNLWFHNAAARWAGVRDLALEKLFLCLEDAVPEVRAAAVYALGTFINAAAERTEHADSVDHTLAMTLMRSCAGIEASPLVRRELVATFACFVQQFESKFISLTSQDLNSDFGPLSSFASSPINSAVVWRPATVAPPAVATCTSRSDTALSMPARPATNTTTSAHSSLSANRGGSLQQASSMVSFGSVYWKLWQRITWLMHDPDPLTSDMTTTLVAQLRHKVCNQMGENNRESFSSCDLSARDSSVDSSSSVGGAMSRSTPPTRRLFTASAAQMAPAAVTTGSASNALQSSTVGCALQTSQMTASVNGSMDDANVYRDMPLCTGFVRWMESFYARPLNLFGSAHQATPTQPFSLADTDHALTRQSTHLGTNHAPPFSSTSSTCPSPVMSGQCACVTSSASGVTSPASGVTSPASGVTSSASCSQLLLCQRLATTPTQLMFAPHSRHLVVADKNKFSVWQYSYDGGGAQVSQYINHVLPSWTRITSLQVINCHHQRPLVAVAANDASVRVWSGILPPVSAAGSGVTRHRHLSGATYTPPSAGAARLVTSWSVAETGAAAASVTRSVGLLISWRQTNAQLIASCGGGGATGAGHGGGAARAHAALSVWDLACERRMCVLSAPTSAAVTAVSTCENERHLVVSGHTDGSVLLYDTRAGHAVVSQREQRPLVATATISGGQRGGAFVVATRFCQAAGAVGTAVVSGDEGGVVRVWDIRAASQLVSFATTADTLSMSFHPTANLLACGSVSQQVVMYSYQGANIDTLRPHDGSLRQRAGGVSCVTFHPVHVVMATCTSDSLLAIYSNGACNSRADHTAPLSQPPPHSVPSTASHSHRPLSTCT